MAGVRAIALYPPPLDVEAFEKRYQAHLSWAPKKIPGLKKLAVGAVGRILATPSEEVPPFYRIAELSFASMEALEAALQAPSTAEVVADAVALSTGGAPLFLIAEEGQDIPI